MKKRWPIVLSVSVLASVLLFVLWKKFPLNPFPIQVDAVERIELKTDSHSHLPGKTQAVLSGDEVRKVIRLVNQGKYDPEITGEPCCTTYWLEVHFADGSQVRIAEGDNWGSMIISPVSGDRYYICSKALVDFVHDLIEQYDMVYD